MRKLLSFICKCLTLTKIPISNNMANPYQQIDSLHIIEGPEQQLFDPLTAKYTNYI